MSRAVGAREGPAAASAEMAEAAEAALGGCVRVRWETDGGFSAETARFLRAAEVVDFKPNGGIIVPMPRRSMPRWRNNSAWYDSRTRKHRIEALAAAFA